MILTIYTRGYSLCFLLLNYATFIFCHHTPPSKNIIHIVENDTFLCAKRTFSVRKSHFFCSKINFFRLKIIKTSH